MLKIKKSRYLGIKNALICRQGVSSVELLVSAIVLISVITFFTTCSFQIHLIWKDIRHQRIGMGELNNQLESITLLTKAEARAALSNLTPSATCENSLRAPRLQGELREDSLGTRVTLQLNWDKRHKGKPLELSGWLQESNPSPAKTESQSQTSLAQPFRAHASRQWASANRLHAALAGLGKEPL
jgi:hypothetical protein